MKKIEKAYHTPTWWYDIRGFFILTLSYRSTLGFQINFFGNNIKNDHLEVAIGTGTLFKMILNWRKRKNLPISKIYGIDYAEPMLIGAKKRFNSNKNITLLKLDVSKTDLPSVSFDSVNIANSVHCFPEVDKAFKEIYRVIKPEGTLAMNVLLYPKGIQPFNWISQKINAWGIKKGILFTPYKKEDIKERVLKFGFEIVTEKVSGNSYNILVKKPKSIT
jgi:ubiquinone/menaquinone biosynthesis C-methylase UbiE